MPDLCAEQPYKLGVDAYAIVLQMPRNLHEEPERIGPSRAGHGFSER